MKRRNFIKMMAAGTGVAVIPSVFHLYTKDELVALEAWKGHLPSEKDIRMVVLSYAILAPSPHNKQAWIIDLKGKQQFDLYVDPSRLLPQTDPPYRQIHIGQGTFLENLDLAARQYGFRAEINYFPQGMYGNTVLEKKPVASISLRKDSTIKKDPYFHQILKRQSNKREYEDQLLTSGQIKKIESVFPSNHDEMSLTITSNSDYKKQLSKIMIEGMKIEVSDQKRDEETIEMFRFNDSEVEKYRDGFGLSQQGITGAKKSLIETFFLSRESAKAKDSTFGKEAVKIVQSQTQSTSSFGWIVTKNNTRLDQVKAGRLYDRINLATTALGISMHPMSQVLQEYSDMAELQKKLKQYLKIPHNYTVQMLFRLGVAEPVIHTPRRKLNDFISKPIR
ncbi:MAG: hypothetical protein ACI86H_003012 [bacterium]|jgi:hypothetical protein